VTSVLDITKFTVAAALHPDINKRTITIRGDSLSIREYYNLYEERTKNKVTLNKIGDASDLKNNIAGLKTQSSNPMAYVLPQYQSLESG
jgi:hypothetical protein